MGPVYGIIPARLTSSRLPGKMLLAETGKPLIQYAWEAAIRAESLDEVIIATDSQQIAAAARDFGARVVLTGDHPSGTDRIAEVVRHHCTDASIVVNLQGDEPELPPASIDRVVMALKNHPHVEMATLATPIRDCATLMDRSCVKVVVAADGRALYFSRHPIPCVRDTEPQELLSELASAVESAPIGDPDADSPAQGAAARMVDSPWLLHLGIYAYRREFLLALAHMPQSRLEQYESLEQLRALEAGAAIQVSVVHERSIGIDTARDYAQFVERMRG